MHRGVPDSVGLRAMRLNQPGKTEIPIHAAVESFSLPEANRALAGLKHGSGLGTGVIVNR